MRFAYLQRLLSPFRDKVARRNVKLPADLVTKVIAQTRTHPWHLSAFSNRQRRWDIWEPCQWIARHISPERPVLDAGCGTAFNLIWLGQNGFRNLYGFDISAEAIRAGRTFAEAANIEVHLWCDDGLAPQQIERNDFGLTLALNWTMYLTTFELSSFLEHYEQYMAPRSHIIFDVIDASFDGVPNSGYHTDDWKKPPHERRPTQYVRRYDRDRVLDTLGVTGLRLVREFHRRAQRGNRLSNYRVVYAARREA